ncbi:MAG: hypothetical protein RLZZ172_548 [Bacteroidota bacterium]|jgi:hypothetical protein
MKRYLLALLMFSLTGAGRHPFYTAVLEVEYSSKTKELGIACKVFPDDMEETLRGVTGKKHDLYQGNKELTNKSLNDYFTNHLKLNINGKTKAMQYLGYEIDKEVAWVYLNVPKLTGVKSIEVNTDLMYAYKSEHINIIHINIDGKRESFRLTAPGGKAFLSK